MIFSHPIVADYLSDNFECAWESVRPVPRLEIDFGNGRTLTRTLQGNVVTYFCLPDGRTYDAIPGLVDPAEYVGRAMTARSLLQPVLEAEDREALVRRIQSEDGLAVQAQPVIFETPRPGHMALTKDSEFNRKHRYPLGRQVLRTYPLETPQRLARHMYSIAMKIQLDDPYLGLAPWVPGGELGRPPPHVPGVGLVQPPHPSEGG